MHALTGATGPDVHACHMTSKWSSKHICICASYHTCRLTCMQNAGWGPLDKLDSSSWSNCQLACVNANQLARGVSELELSPVLTDTKPTDQEERGSAGSVRVGALQLMNGLGRRKTH